ncbi:MAG: DegT/DnrJ/EryC1/StrS aminotransferase family protein [Elusimicrobia bacterium]|nr:MAG: DegT/DnrJ/EryC1/StrS aminotransferase family protein [Elusimicrobiota bacterium]
MPGDLAAVKFLRFDPQACAFPKPRVPLLPATLRLRSPFAPPASERRSSGSRNFRHFVRGRYALAAAYRLSGLGPGTVLLAPAYHCVTMIDPALACTADVHCYRLHRDLTPDLSSLDSLYTRLEKPVKAVLATHFFGFPCDFDELRRWCDARRITLVEDCSHALFSERWRAPGIGHHGHWVTSSPYKFFPSDDGGLLYSPHPDQLAKVRTTSATLVDELRGLKHLLEKRSNSRPGRSDITEIDRQLAALAARIVVAGDEDVVTCAHPSPLYLPPEVDRASLLSSRFLVDQAQVDDLIRRRRHNYQSWLDAVASFPNCHPLLPTLPPDCIPYMFPLYIDHPNPHFYWLKHLGVPVWRWDEMAVSDCPIAGDYRQRLLHLPCHQDLNDAQIDWLLAAVGKTLSHSPVSTH